ncbi:MAG: hypothetical protein IKI40_00580 [Treponema sp.]|nr:hypothetical protein [Treponema sp.]
MNKSKLGLAWRISLKSIIPNLCSALPMFIYSIIVAQLSELDIFIVLRFVLAFVLVFQFSLGLYIDFLVTKKSSDQLNDFYSDRESVKDTVSLLKEIAKAPVKIALTTLAFFIIGTIALTVTYEYYFHIPKTINILSFIECIYASYLAAVFSFNNVRNICREDMANLVEYSTNQDTIKKYQFFGLSLSKQFAIYVIIPVIVCCITAGYSISLFYFPLDMPLPWCDMQSKILRAVLTVSINFVSVVILSILFKNSMESNNKKIETTLNKIETSDISKTESLRTDLFDEISYNYYLANQIIMFMKKVISKAKEMGSKIDEYSKELVAISTQTQATAVEQSTGTSEILSIMNEADKLSHEIETKTTEVSTIASKTAESVQNGTQFLADNMVKMFAIYRANTSTTNGIREVNEKINSIWEIVSIINSIADQTKIIAFNAELESTTVNESGRNFRNVSNEIRRLANGTMDRTKEIKERINEVQLASDKLLQSSQNCTEKINQGMELIESLENSFTIISKSASETAESSEEIEGRIKQETEAFEQIVTTLQQVSKNIESLSVSTKTITVTAESLQTNSSELSILKEAEESSIRNR